MTTYTDLKKASWLDRNRVCWLRVTWAIATGCICGCEYYGCISRKRLHAAANRETLQEEHNGQVDRYAGEDRYSRHPGSRVELMDAGGDSSRLYLDEEVSGCRRWDGTPECVNSWAELHFWMERCKWRSLALMGFRDSTHAASRWSHGV